MKKLVIIFWVIFILGCKEQPKTLLNYPKEYLYFENKVYSQNKVDFTKKRYHFVFSFDASCTKCKESLKLVNSKLNTLQEQSPNLFLVIANVPDTTVFKMIMKDFEVKYPIVVDLYNEFYVFNRGLVRNPFGFYKIDENGFFEKYKELCNPQDFIRNN